jgi:5-formyltetrahydrofolate cyclo-ligase
VYWNTYRASIPNKRHLQDVFVSAGYAGTPQITDELLALYLSGKKSAGSSVMEDFLTAGDPLPQVGNYWIYLNSSGDPSCILRTEKVVMNKFKDVPVEIAIAEGEGDLSLEYWRRVHSELYSPCLVEWGVKSMDEATMVTEFFKIVFR